jgi:ABC-type lipoprotein release transport system permease subunit
MTFEQNPLVLVVFIVLTVEGWNLAKLLTRSLIERRRRAAIERR